MSFDVISLLMPRGRRISPGLKGQQPLFSERTRFQCLREGGEVAARDVLVGGLAHPGHRGALRGLSDCVDQYGEERLIEVVSGKRLDRLRNEFWRQFVELKTHDIDTSADVNQGDLGALAGGDAD